jgi:hypothetical protein
MAAEIAGKGVPQAPPNGFLVMAPGRVVFAADGFVVAA